MTHRSFGSRRRTAFALVTAAAVATGTLVLAAPAAHAEPAGTVTEVAAQPQELWIPGTGSAQRFTYWSTGPDGAPALSSGAYYTPPGPAPEGGWPVLAWAHGTTGLADDCAPSTAGPALPERDNPYLSRWLSEGYAIVATDYVGLGTPGVMPYLDGTVEAHSVVDSVKAARAIDPELSNRWAVIGQSQGGGAAIITARYATEFGGDELDYRGAVGTGVPANIELTLLPAGPGFPPVALPKGITAYVFYILAGLRSAHPELDLNTFLTPEGRNYTDLAEQQCIGEFEESVAGVVLGDAFSRPLSDIPDLQGLLHDYMGVPTSGYDRPLFIGQGLRDTDVPAPSALSLVAALEANGEPVTLKAYDTDHSGALVQSQDDAVPFVRGLFA